MTWLERRATIGQMAELKHQQQQWPACQPTRLATMRPQSRPLILFASVVQYRKGQRNAHVAPDGRRRILDADRAMIVANVRQSTDQAIANREIP